MYNPLLLEKRHIHMKTKCFATNNDKMYRNIMFSSEPKRIYYMEPPIHRSCQAWLKVSEKDEIYESLQMDSHVIAIDQMIFQTR